MGLFGQQRKVTAAVRSMHQYCPAIRAVFCELPQDRAVEAVTAFLYVKMTEEIFGRKFALRVRNDLKHHYKFADPDEIEERLAALCVNVEHFRQLEDADAAAHDSHEQVIRQVRSVLRAMLVEAGDESDDDGKVRDMFPRFEEAVRTVRAHLLGIRRQSNFIMKS